VVVVVVEVVVEEEDGGVEVVVEGMNQGAAKAHGKKQNKSFMPSLA
jgi:hypothetical protein